MTAIAEVGGGPFAAGASLVYTATLRDASGSLIPGSALDSLTLTLSTTATGAVVNGVYRTDILNNGGRGTVDEDGLLTITLLPADTLLPGAPVGTRAQRSMVIDWTFNDGGYTGRHEARLTFVALTEQNA